MICYVILHYQSIEDTRKCIRSIRKYTTDSYKIIVVDNASPNGTGEILKEEYQNDTDISVCLSEVNAGFARGNNLGYVEAKKYSPDYIVVLNSDIELTQKDFCEKLVKADIEYSFDVLGPDIFSARAGYHQNPQRLENYSISELLKSEKKLKLKNQFRCLLYLKYKILHRTINQKIHENDYTKPMTGIVLHGAFYVFSRNFIESHDDCFYPGTFMYYESYILHYLGMREHNILLYYPEIKVIHHEDASTNATYSDQYKKSIFVNKCLLDSCREFIQVMNGKTESKR